MFFAMPRLSLVVVTGGYSLAVGRGLLTAVACFRAQAVGLMGFGSCAQVQQLWCTGLVTLRHVESSQTKD